MVIGAPARRLAKIADANFAIRFAICTSDYTTQHYVSQTSAKTWSQWAAIQERIGLNSGWLPGEQRTALAAPLGLTVRSHLTDNSAASHAGGDARPPPSANSNLSVRRQPSCDHSYFAVKSFDATLLVGRLGVSNDDQRWLELGFSTKADGKKNVSLFNTAIYPRHFVELARMMVEADTEAAIHAFGAAMQTAEVERRRPLY